LSGSVMSGWAVLTRWSEGWSVSDPVTSDPVTAGPGAVTAGPKCLVGSHNAPCVAKRGTVFLPRPRFGFPGYRKRGVFRERRKVRVLGLDCLWFAAGCDLGGR